MFSKIGEFLKPLSPHDSLPAHEPAPVRKSGGDPKDGRRRDGRRDRAEAQNPPEDMALFSVNALRVFLRAEAEAGRLEADCAEKLLNGLDALDRSGVKSIPIRPEQPLISAVEDALQCLGRTAHG